METSTAQATAVSNDSWHEMPAACPFGNLFRQGAVFLYIGASAPRNFFASGFRSLVRYAIGSNLARVANSSTSVSMTNALCVCPTERHHNTGTFTVGWCAET